MRGGISSNCAGAGAGTKSRWRFFFQAEDGIRGFTVTGVQTCALPILLNLNSVMIGTMQSKMLADFYGKVFGKPAEMVDNENGFFGWQVGNTYFSILEHSEMGGNAKDPGRVMMNFETKIGRAHV